MNGDVLVDALQLPASSRVDQRVPKKLLLENGAPTSADKRIINEGVEELVWLAALKPTTIGVPEFRDDTREYLEIAVLRLALREAAKAGRLLELIHRAIPYPLLLVTEHRQQVDLSAAHKRWSQNEAGRTVLDGTIIRHDMAGREQYLFHTELCAALPLASQPRSSLFAVYQGWVDVILASQVARICGEFRLPRSPAHSQARQVALQELSELDLQTSALRTAAGKERQLARLIELNLKLQRVEAAKVEARNRL